jgi:hypothetical protein
LIAVAIFVASCAVLINEAPDQYANVVPEVVPSLPPVKVELIQLKFGIVLPSAMASALDPVVAAVRITTEPVELAAIPVPAGQACSAVFRFDASVTVLLLVANVPEVKLGHVFVPADPAVTAPHEKRPVLFAAPTARYGPAAALVTVNVLPVLSAVIPTAGYDVLQALIAAAILAASAVVLAPRANVPFVALLQPFTGGKPVVTALHAKLLALPPSVSVLAALPSVVLEIVTTAPVAYAVTPSAG